MPLPIDVLLLRDITHGGDPAQAETVAERFAGFADDPDRPAVGAQPARTRRESP
jgi:hypothetical protein